MSYLAEEVEVGKMTAGVHQLHHDVDTGSYLVATHQKEGQLSLKGRASLVLSINR